MEDQAGSEPVFARRGAEPRGNRDGATHGSVRYFPQRLRIGAEVADGREARAAEHDGATAAECLRLFIEAAISQRNELVLPLHGGPPPTSLETKTVRDEIHRIVQRMLERGIADATLHSGITPRDIIVFGAMLAQPRPTDPDWDATCRRLLATYLAGLG